MLMWAEPQGLTQSPLHGTNKPHPPHTLLTPSSPNPGTTWAPVSKHTCPPCLCSEAGGAAAHAAPPCPPETAAPMELGARTQTVQEGEKRTYLFFVHCKQSSISGEDPLCSSASHSSANVSWAQSTVKKDSLENGKHYSKNVCCLFLINS